MGRDKISEFTTCNRQLIRETTKGALDTNGLFYSRMNESSLQMLENSDTIILMGSMYISIGMLSMPREYSWEVININKTSRPQKVSAPTKTIPLLDVLLPTLNAHSKIVYLTAFTIYLHKSRVRNVENLSVYVMTNSCTAVLLADINAMIELYGQGNKEPGAIHVEPVGILIPVHFCSR